MCIVLFILSDTPTKRLRPVVTWPRSMASSKDTELPLCNVDQNALGRNGPGSENGSSCDSKQLTMNSEDHLRYRAKRKPVQCANGSETKRIKYTKELQKRDRFCWICHREPATLSCHTCPRSFHPSCVNLKAKTLSEWVCPECVRVMAAENMDTRSPGLAQLGVDEFCSLLQFALQRLKQHTHEAFLRPVCTKMYPSYTDYVSHPFDLSILEKNVRWKHYGCTESFINDARWIYHNCIIFNGYNHRLSMSAKVLMKVCKQEMEEIEVCPDCYKNANTHESWFTEPCRRPHLLVWAKLKGFPYWPAKAMRVRDGNVDARFFGAHDRAWVPLSQCYHLSKEYPTDAKNRKKGLQNAMEELEIYIQKYKEKFRDFTYRSPKESVTQADVENARMQEAVASWEPGTLNSSTPVKRPSTTAGDTDVSLNSRGSTSNDRVKTAGTKASSEKSDPFASSDGDPDSEPLAVLRRKVRMDDQKEVPATRETASDGKTGRSANESKGRRAERHHEQPKDSPSTEKSLQSINLGSQQEQSSPRKDSPSGKPQGIFEVSSELPGELKIRVSKKDMEDLPKKVNRSVEDLVSTLRKIQRSISTDSNHCASPDTAPEEENKDTKSSASPMEKQTPKDIEDADKMADKSGPSLSPTLQTEDGVAPADDFKEKLKKTILICKEKIGDVKEVDLEEEDVEEEEEEQGEEEGEAEEKVEGEEEGKDDDMAKDGMKHRDESLAENGTSMDSWDSSCKAPGRAKMKFTSRRSSTERMLTNGSLELSSTGSDPLDDKPLSALRQSRNQEDMAERCKEEMTEFHHNFALALKEMRICWGLELKRALAAAEETNAAEVNKAVADAKKKQWCANCWKEAVFYCCWNTSYCDYPCQQAHWPKHMSSCTQATTQVQAATGVTAVVNNSSLTELSLTGDKSTVILPNSFQAATPTPLATEAQPPQASLLRTTLSANTVQLSVPQARKTASSFASALPPGLSVTPLHHSNA